MQYWNESGVIKALFVRVVNKSLTSLCYDTLYTTVLTDRQPFSKFNETPTNQGGIQPCLRYW